MDNKIDFQQAAQKLKDKQSKERWNILFKALKDMISLQPWQYMKPADTLAYIPQGEMRTVFFQCEQQEDEILLQIYPTEYAFGTELEASKGEKEVKRQQIERDCITIVLTEKERLSKEMREKMKKHGVSYPKKMWPVLYRKRYGYPIALLEEDEILFLIHSLGHFMMEIQLIQSKYDTVGFEQGKMMLRFFDAKQGLWVNAAVPRSLPNVEKNVLQIHEDSAIFKRLQTVPSSETIKKVEFDFGWETVVTQRNIREVPCFHAVVTLTDRDTEEALCTYACAPDELVDCAISAWCELIQKHGKPEVLYISRARSHQIFADFAEKLGIKMKRVKKLPGAERVLKAQETV